MSSLLEVRDVSTGYSEVEIVHEVSMRVERGEIVTIIGPNGAGKSTLLKAVFGLLPISAGSVRFDGVDVTRYNAPRMVAAGASFVPQTENVFASLSIHENLEMGAYQRSDGRAGTEQRIDEVLSLFPDLDGRRGERASRLSGGQRQALAIARALMLDPKLLLLDEVSAALSPIMREQTFARIAAIAADGVAVLMIEQNATEALAISSRGYVLVGGQNALDQDAAEMLANPDVGRLFLGRDEGEHEAVTEAGMTPHENG
ncbi:MAG TPA: ABC transporter ATP-binding protein [Dehalococcoidia bacterium]|nr:ABC transporter ATP-binding protein [Dehalococcoidia bacterium]